MRPSVKSVFQIFITLWYRSIVCTSLSVSRTQLNKQWTHMCAYCARLHKRLLPKTVGRYTDNSNEFNRRLHKVRSINMDETKFINSYFVETGNLFHLFYSCASASQSMCKISSLWTNWIIVKLAYFTERNENMFCFRWFLMICFRCNFSYSAYVGCWHLDTVNQTRICRKRFFGSYNHSNAMIYRFFLHFTIHFLHLLLVVHSAHCTVCIPK